jgi:hypothetical protein
MAGTLTVFGRMDPGWVEARARLDLAHVVAPAEVEETLLPAIDTLLEDKDQFTQALVAAKVLRRAGRPRVIRFPPDSDWVGTGFHACPFT